jgi:RNase adapter protein RapZ
MQNLHVIIFTGVSGGGKTTALHAVEDLGFYCVDNLPLPLLGDFVEAMKAEPGVDRVALVVDARLRNYLDGYALAFLALRSGGLRTELLYLDASNEVLLRRFSQTRRRHPLAGDDLQASLEEERRLLSQMRAQASLCIDTSEITPHELKRIVQDRYEQRSTTLAVTLLSFGFRYGLPAQADIVLDSRFLPNPFFVDELRLHTGTDPRVAEFVMRSADSKEFLEKAEDLLRFLLPRFEQEGKVYLSVAIGCTGGKHRSVALVEELGRRLANDRTIKVRHRDIER